MTAPIHYVGELLLVGDVGGEVLEAVLVDGARGQCTAGTVHERAA